MRALFQLAGGTFSLCPVVLLDEGSTHATLLKSTSVKALYPETVTLSVTASVHRFGRNTIQSIKVLSPQIDLCEQEGELNFVLYEKL